MLRQKAGQGITCSHFCRSTYFIDDGDLCAERAGYRFTVLISVQKCSIYKMARCLSPVSYTHLTLPTTPYV